jgi:hypothetical protein
MNACIFIRNDDVWTLDREFCFFFDAAIDRGIPVVHAVIPGKMDQKLIRFLCRAKNRTPQLLDIVQHGWTHANHSVEAGTKYEFGPSRSYTVQREDIQQGLKRMRTVFGELFTPAFVPPYHGYDQRTLRALQEESFQIFSAAGSRRPSPKRRFIEMPAPVSFTRYEKGQKKIQNAKDMVGFLARDINRRPLSGVLTHHADFSTGAFRRELTLFFDYIAALKAKEGWRVLLFSEMLPGLKTNKKVTRKRSYAHQSG